MCVCVCLCVCLSVCVCVSVCVCACVCVSHCSLEAECGPELPVVKNKDSVFMGQEVIDGSDCSRVSTVVKEKIFKYGVKN